MAEFVTVEVSGTFRVRVLVSSDDDARAMAVQEISNRRLALQPKTWREWWAKQFDIVKIEQWAVPGTARVVKREYAGGE
jgi:hypothetical protein